MESLNLNATVVNIQTRNDFIDFVHALLNNLEDQPAEWENTTTRQYLQALAAWVEDMDGYFLNRREPVPSSPTWQLLGQILLAAKYYE